MKKAVRNRRAATLHKKSAERKTARKTRNSVAVQVPRLIAGLPGPDADPGVEKFRDPEAENLELEMRSGEEISEAVDEVRNRIWYNRRLVNLENIELGKEEAPPPEIMRGMLDHMRACEQKYGRRNLGPFDDWDWGYLNGKLAALRWVLGLAWDDLGI